MELGALVKPLVGVFVVATLMESALATIFNWRLYREFFDGHATKTLVMIAAGWAVVECFDYDLFQKIVSAAGGPAEQGEISKPLSALVLAGGSSAIYELFKSLGLRPPAEPPDARQQPAENKAWVSVKILPDQAVGDIQVHIDPVDNPTDAERAAPPIAGVLRGQRGFGERIRSVFFADRMRLPAYGGKTIDAGEKVYRIVVSGTRLSDDRDADPIAFSENVYIGRFANRAVVDFMKVI